MSSFTRTGTSGTLLGQGDDRKRSNYYAPTLLHQILPSISHSPSSEMYWTGEPHQSCVSTNLAPNTSLWPSSTLPDPPVYGGIGTGYPSHEARLASLPGGNADGSVLDVIGMQVTTTAVPEQAIPAAPTVLPAFQPSPPPSLNWPRASGPPCQSAPSWKHPVYSARQYSGHHSSTGSFSMRPETSPFQQDSSSAITGYPVHIFMPAGSLPNHLSNSVQAVTPRSPVPVASSTLQSRGERWDLSNEATFQCSWTSQCAALIAGNRRSVTNHLRDKHNFMTDGQAVACTWGECTAYMQRRNIPRHIVACHFEIKVTCPTCDVAFSRADAYKKHLLLTCPGREIAAVVEGMGEDEGGYFYRR